MHVDGACFCGAITFSAQVDPQSAGICHCTDCQTLSGSAFRVLVRTTAERFTLLSGNPKLYVKTAQSGTPRAQAFCPDCGTQLWGCNAIDESGLARANTNLDFGRISIRVGALRQRDKIAPLRQIWCRSASPWLAKLSELPREV